jgi:diguanylate cyclase (GGDEF)-like protein
LRSTDILGRWGGEEFLMLFLDPMPEHATLCLNQLHSSLLTQPVCAINPDLRITFSAGITRYIDGETADTTIARADKGLYEAKAAGRNQTILL